MDFIERSYFYFWCSDFRIVFLKKKIFCLLFIFVHENFECEILKAASHKRAAVRPPTTHLENNTN